MYLLHEQKSRFLTVLVFVLLVFKLARGTFFPVLDPRAGVPLLPLQIDYISHATAWIYDLLWPMEYKQKC